ncbi:adenosylmethionine--8-amino-7-oxononanoate transaminase [Altibacter sp. HG106]|uniref:adenosylmethionine--8-amino-7-oxononanoate transaminase n=1 Tax=Altibacter sp. HG106 TaxID=3023937 RepID=UPI00234FBA41|nr:adenosylmethionine--8-amino-7-oxononanoate transaminase [Altibacter sp. HG106]MDC7995199.1 adenosylmethionine--8-amino-7-oxononanoate transaminase [Altibacter sp. HG106]
MSLEQRDRDHIWHPLTQHQTAAPPLGIVKAEGVWLFDEAGNTYIDGISSWYTAVYGHCHPELVKAVQDQAARLDQVVFTGFTHEPAVQLAEKLIGILPSHQAKVFFNDNGSTAVEAAIKMALQYHDNKGQKRKKLLAFSKGFHGDTLAAMSASNLSVYNGPFEEHFMEVIRIDPPQVGVSAEYFEGVSEILDIGDIAAFIFEPLVQGAAGMKFHDAAGLSSLLQMCKKHDVLCIADEVMTGFGKTGKHFASQYLTETPDIICLSKALTAGVLPMGITSCTQQVFEAFLDNDITKGFFHAHTYSANPLACAVASRAIDLLQSEEIQKGIQRIQGGHEAFVKELESHSLVSNPRSLGVILAFELNVTMERYGNLRQRMYDFLMERGCYLRPLGNTLYLVPPYVISSEALEQLYEGLRQAIDRVAAENS